MVSENNLAHEMDMKSDDVQTNKSAVSVMDGGAYELEAKLKKGR